MEVITLLENDSLNSVYKNKSGLCLYVKTKRHNILFDLGPNELFIERAKELSIDIEDIDIVVISHGHKDHGGGLKAFLEKNKKARIYINKNAFTGYYSNFLRLFKVYVGLDKAVKCNERINLVDDYFEIDEELIIFSKVGTMDYIPDSNRGLFKKSKQGFVLDNFDHEQNLIIKEDGKYNLFIGCGHNGVTNIIKEGERLFEKNMDNITGGFQLFTVIRKKGIKRYYIDDICNSLLEGETMYYSCHFTNERTYGKLKKIMGDKIIYLKSGKKVHL